MRNVFWQTLKKNGLLLVVLIAAIIASIAVSVTPPLILQYIVDSLVSGSFSAVSCRAPVSSISARTIAKR